MAQVGDGEKAAMRMQTSRGVVWKWPHSSDSFYGMKAAEYEVRDIAEKGIVVIVCKDGISCEKDADDTGELDEMVRQANRLLEFRWWKGQLMDAIVSSHKFGAGDYKGSIEDGFRRVDETVEVLVNSLDTTMLDWTEPVVWRAFYNTLVVIVTPVAVHIAGAGGFVVKSIQNGGLERVSPFQNLLIAGTKSCLADGRIPSEFIASSEVPHEVESAHEWTVNESYRKYDMKEMGPCIIVEQFSPHSRSGAAEWLAHGEDWEAALTAVSQDDWVAWMHFEAMVLDLAHPDVPASLPAEQARSGKRQKVMPLLPAAPTLVPV